MSLDKLICEMKKAIDLLKGYGTQLVHVIHHDDADGVTGAAIISKALERAGFNVKRICIEKAYPEVIRRLHRSRGEVYVYVDIGAAHAQLISRENAGKNLTIILDHHDAEPSTDELVLNLDPELYGFSGESEVSGSTTTYLFAKLLSDVNKDLAFLAIVGSMEIPGNLRGLNREALKDALELGEVSVRKKGAEEIYHVKKEGFKGNAKSLSSMLTVLASVGYYRGGPELAVKACLEGFRSHIRKLVDEFREERKKVMWSVIRRLKMKGLEETTHLQWFHVQDSFRGMGVKVIGTCCSMLLFQKWINPRKYLLGFMNMSPEIPGFGRLEGQYVKVSARTPSLLSEDIKKGRAKPLAKLLPEAANAVGGFGDGHAVAASGVIPRGSENTFIERMEALIAR